ncbi:ahpc tsa antioxidant enzyme domain-containing [Trichoderma arundinaceum]|uniref:Ahpc tsa antioxidant enzyme domain-containing n=1 Tax=Trichoderma arundinaceum TaxID=490622 RepID=A0A395NVU9_TRIAR|nr:ahpc tsa antioxidant enzyme domain-containing [Trichoderma arundinaceum]
MLSSLTTKLALRKVGLSSDALDFSALTTSSSSSSSSPSSRQKSTQDANENNTWGTWPPIPLKAHPWFSPPPPPVKVGPVPRIGDAAPLDRRRRLQLGLRSKCLVVFLRCVGCAFAQKTFLALRAIANRHPNTITCIAVSHASPRATNKWLDLLGGPWSVQIVVDQERAIYAAWGLGVASSVWYVLSPAAQVQSWRETGWLGDEVAGAMARGDSYTRRRRRSGQDGDGGGGALTDMGSKWQEAGAFAVDGRGTVVWGVKAARADDVMDLEEGAKLLML